MPEKLKIGLLTDGKTIPYWAACIVKTLNRSDYADVILVVENTEPGDPCPAANPKPPENNARALLAKIWKNSHKLVHIAFNFTDSFVEKVSRRSTPGYNDPVLVSELLPDSKVIAVKPRKTRHIDRLGEEDLQAIKETGVDILFRLGFRILGGEMLNVARYGVWSYHHGDNQQFRGGPNGYWELTSQNPTSGVILQILNEDLDAGTVIHRSWSLPDKLLLSRQRQNIFLSAQAQFPRMVEKLYRQGEEAFFATVQEQNQHPDFYSNRLFVAPGNLAAIASLGIHYGKYLGYKLFRLVYKQQWILLFHFKANGHLSQSMWRFKEILPPRDRIWADPFPVYRHGEYHVFIEEMTFSRGKGHISVLSIKPDGSYSKPVEVIKQPYHMSYPFIFEYDNELYMIPETGDNRTIELYRCTDFPNSWAFEKTLMNDVFAVDATLHERDGIWWMFVTIQENEHTNCLDELYIFSADNPLSDEWVKHPACPVSCDVRTARPAGKIFEQNGNLYRPSQNGSRRYGYGMKINHIKTLTADAYEEECVSDITPSWKQSIAGTHTLNHANTLTVSDAIKYRFRYFRGFSQ